MKKPSLKVCHYSDIPEESGGPETTGVIQQRLIDKSVDAPPTFELLLVKIEPGGRTHNHSHSYEHQQYFLEGDGEVQIDGKRYPVAPGYVVLIPPDAQHTCVNTGNKPLKFLCGFPIPDEKKHG